MTPVVLVCSPFMVATAKGSGRPIRSRQSPEIYSIGVPADAKKTYEGYLVCTGYRRRQLWIVSVWPNLTYVRFDVLVILTFGSA